MEIIGTQGCALVGSQGTTLSASDLHNARATILNPFYNTGLGYELVPNRHIRHRAIIWTNADPIHWGIYAALVGGGGGGGGGS